MYNDYLSIYLIRYLSIFYSLFNRLGEGFLSNPFYTLIANCKSNFLQIYNHTTQNEQIIRIYLFTFLLLTAQCFIIQYCSSLRTDQLHLLSISKLQNFTYLNFFEYAIPDLETEKAAFNYLQKEYSTFNSHKTSRKCKAKQPLTQSTRQH